MQIYLCYLLHNEHLIIASSMYDGYASGLDEKASSERIMRNCVFIQTARYQATAGYTQQPGGSWESQLMPVTH